MSEKKDNWATVNIIMSILMGGLLISMVVCGPTIINSWDDTDINDIKVEGSPISIGNFTLSHDNDSMVVYQDTLIRPVVVYQGQNETQRYINISPNQISPIKQGDTLHLSYFYHPLIPDSVDALPFIMDMMYRYNIKMTYTYDLSLNYTDIPMTQYITTLDVFGLGDGIPLVLLQIPQDDSEYLVAFQGVNDIKEVEYWIIESKRR